MMSDQSNSRKDVKRGEQYSQKTNKNVSINVPDKPPLDELSKKTDVKHETKLREKVQDLKEKLHPPRPKKSDTNSQFGPNWTSRKTSNSLYGVRQSIQATPSRESSHEPINLTLPRQMPSTPQIEKSKQKTKKLLVRNKDMAGRIKVLVQERKQNK